MKRILFFLGCILFFKLTLFAHNPQAKGSIEYRISMPMPQSHYFEVEIRLNNFHEDYVDFKLPVWTPGSYLIREYAKNVEGFSASVGNEGNPVSFQKINKNTWRIAHKKANYVNVTYRVYAFEESVRMSYLDENHAFIMSNTLLMYIEALRNTSTVLKLDIPEQWKKVSTTLSRLEGKEYAFYVPNYDILVDSPIEIGNFETIEFNAAGIPHEVVMYGAASFNRDQISRDLSKIIETATDVFGENPNEKYIFFVHHADKGAGGLEHLSSTVLGVNRWAYSNPTSYNNFLALAAHEYFHLWLVKRLKPIELDVIDYDEEVYTDLLWVMEGIASYFEEKIMLRAGFNNEDTFLKNLLYAMEKIQNAPGSEVQSVAEASFDAWIKYYRKNENSDNSQISYYTKGTILGALLDLSIIHSSGGKRTLDDILNQLYDQFYKKKGKGIVTEDLKMALEKAAGDDLSAFFNDYVYGTKDLAYAKFLSYAGINLVETNSSSNPKSVGIRWRNESGGLFVSSVLKNGSAYDNGIYVGDELIAINGYRISNSNLNMLIDQFNIGEKVSFLISRRGVIKNIELDIRKDTSVSYTYAITPDRSKSQEKVYESWMGK